QCDGQGNVTNHTSRAFLLTDSPPNQEMPVTGNSLWLRVSRRPAYASAGVFRADHQQQEKMQMPKFFRLAALLAAVAFPTAAFAQQGTVTGTVTDAQTTRPLSGVQVVIAGTGVGTITTVDGRFLLTNVPAGQQEVQAQMIGYAIGSEVVNVTSGGTTTVSFALRQSAVELDAVVVTGTAGGQQRRAVGNAVSSV